MGNGFNDVKCVFGHATCVYIVFLIMRAEFGFSLPNFLLQSKLKSKTAVGPILWRPYLSRAPYYAEKSLTQSGQSKECIVPAMPFDRI